MQIQKYQHKSELVAFINLLVLQLSLKEKILIQSKSNTTQKDRL